MSTVYLSLSVQLCGFQRLNEKRHNNLINNNQLIAAKHQSVGSQGSSYYFELQQSSTFSFVNAHEGKLALAAKYACVLAVEME